MSDKENKTNMSFSLTTLKDLLKIKSAILEDKNWASTDTEFHKECRGNKVKEVEDLTASIAKLECFELLRHENEKLVKENEELREALEQIELACDGGNPHHYIVWRLAEQALKK